MATYKGILTNNGKALLASATVTNPVNYSHLAVGDGNGSTPAPLETRTALVNEKARVALNVVEINPSQNNQIVCEGILPTNVGGFHIREFGLFADSVMIVNGNYPLTYKPAVNEGGAREIAIKVIINVQSAEVIALYLDDSLIYATREWVKNNYIPRADIIDNLTTNDATKPVSAKQAKVLNDKVESIEFGAGGLKNKVDTNDTRLSNAREWTAETVSKAEAEAGTATTRRAWTAQRVHQAATAMLNAATTTFTRTLLSRSTAAQLRSDLSVPAVTGEGATGDWDINATATKRLNSMGSWGFNPSYLSKSVLQMMLSTLSGRIDGTDYCDLLTLNSHYDNTAGMVNALAFDKLTHKLYHWQGGFEASNWGLKKQIAYVDSNVASATKLATARNIALSGAVTGSANFDGSDNINIATTITPIRIEQLYVDLNDFQTAGFYYCDADEIAASVVNSPTEYSFSLFVESTAGVNQKLTVYIAGGGVTFTRGYYNGSWSKWEQVAFTSGNVASATKLATARYIEGSQFDGTNNITLNTITAKHELYGLNPTYLTAKKLELMFSTLSSGLTSSDYCDLLTLNSWHDETGGLVNALALSKVGAGVWHFQGAYGGGNWASKRRIAYIDENVASASKLATARNIALSGAVTGSANFDGSGNINIATTLQQGLGVGQTWQDMKAARSKSTTYTNTTGKPIVVKVVGLANPGGTHNRGYIGGSINDIFSSNSNSTGTLTLVVPSGENYMVEGDNLTILHWMELR